MRLRAVTIPLEDDGDLLAVSGPDGWFFSREDAGLAGRGVAARIELPAGITHADAIVDAALSSIEVEDRVGLPGCGPLAVGALPFRRDAPSSLVIPAVVVGRAADGTRWITTIGQPCSRPFGKLSAPQDPDGFDLTSPIPHAEWMELVARAVEDGSVGKVVLAREVAVTANRPIDIPTVLRRLRSLYPACTVLSFEVADGRFVAASPELLVARTGATVTSHPLAGTIPRSGDPATDDALAAGLLNSAKERAEHDFVVQDVAHALRPLCRSIDIPAGPSIVPLRNVSHLGTRITGTLLDGAPSALGLAERLHPTPAVCGTPRDAALAWLDKNEGFDRGPYAGPAGWVDRHGDGEWVVGIRSAVVDGASARLFAGVGVVDGSDPAAELAETQFKLQALLAAVVRP